jgi:hypothetical protein
MNEVKAPKNVVVRGVLAFVDMSEERDSSRIVHLVVAMMNKVWAWYPLSEPIVGCLS